MAESDEELSRRVRDVLAIVVDDIDSVTAEVEDRVAYVEGIVPTEEQRMAICRALRNVDGLQSVITCVATERIRNSSTESGGELLYPPPLMMHYHSLS